MPGVWCAAFGAVIAVALTRAHAVAIVILVVAGVAAAAGFAGLVSSSLA